MYDCECVFPFAGKNKPFSLTCCELCIEHRQRRRHHPVTVRNTHRTAQLTATHHAWAHATAAVNARVCHQRASPPPPPPQSQTSADGYIRCSYVHRAPRCARTQPDARAERRLFAIDRETEMGLETPTHHCHTIFP